MVSDRVPMCHITGGAALDLQPVAEAVLADAPHTAVWEASGSEQEGDMLSTVYVHREDQRFTLLVSRAAAARGRTDRVQVIATALYAIP